MRYGRDKFILEAVVLFEHLVSFYQFSFRILSLCHIEDDAVPEGVAAVKSLRSRDTLKPPLPVVDSHPSPPVAWRKLFGGVDNQAIEFGEVIGMNLVEQDTAVGLYLVGFKAK